MEESDTYLMILEEGQVRCSRDNVLIVGEERLGAPDESVKTQLQAVADLWRLKRMLRCAAKAASWQQIVDTP